MATRTQVGRRFHLSPAMHLVPTIVRAVGLIDSAAIGLRPEVVAGRTPFVLQPLGGAARVSAPRGDGSGRLWVRLFLGLRSSSSQRRAGIWMTREDWVWTDLSEGMALMAEEQSPGYLVAVVETWAEATLARPGVWVVDGAAWKPADRWTWLVDSIAEDAISDFAGHTYLYRLRRGKGLPAEQLDRKSWRSQLLA